MFFDVSNYYKLIITSLILGPVSVHFLTSTKMAFYSPGMVWFSGLVKVDLITVSLRPSVEPGGGATNSQPCKPKNFFVSVSTFFLVKRIL